ncbi:unnamed protein product, partial [marine sediment metagenome]
YNDRITLLNTIVNTLKCLYILYLTPHHRHFAAFYKEVVREGGEGIMLKKLSHPYEGGKRSKGMFKWKKHKDMDCFITGFMPGKGDFAGLVGSLLVSVLKKGKAVEVAAVQPGTLDFRREITTPGGELKDALYSKVVEVSYLTETKNRRLRHAVLVKFRPEKNIYDCEVING